MEKKKLLILLGAGSSIPYGMPSVTAIGDQMKAWAPVIAQHPVAPDFFNLLWETTRAYRKSSQFTGFGSPEPNFEQILGHMIGLAAWESPSPMGNVLRYAVINGSLPENWVVPMENPDTAKFGQRVIILHQMVKFLGALAKYMRRYSRAIDPAALSFSTYRSAISALREQFDVGIYNLNYDGLAMAAWPEAFTGFDDNGRFDPSGVHQRKEWGFIYHLHGSVHHTLGEEHGSEIKWMRDISTLDFHDGDATPASLILSDDKIFPRTTLIAGGFKLDQLLLDPFQTFYASFIRHAHDAAAILIGGYGFGDIHVNQALSNRLSGGADRPPIAVVTKSWSDDDLMAGRDIHGDRWSRDLNRYLRCSFNSSAGRITGVSDLSSLIERGAFEESGGNSVGIWHGGFETVSTFLELFAQRLR